MNMATRKVESDVHKIAVMMENKKRKNITDERTTQSSTSNEEQDSQGSALYAAIDDDDKENTKRATPPSKTSLSKPITSSVKKIKLEKVVQASSKVVKFWQGILCYIVHCEIYESQKSNKMEQIKENAFRAYNDVSAKFLARKSFPYNTFEQGAKQVSATQLASIQKENNY